MSYIEDELTAYGVTWNNVVTQATDYMDGRFFFENRVYHLSFQIDTSDKGFRSLDISGYKVRSFLDWQQNRVEYNDFEYEVAPLVANTGNTKVDNPAYYVTHGNEFIVPATTASYIANLKLLGADKTKVKQSIENELKSFYSALMSCDTERIYSTMTRLKDSYKNILQENSFDTTVKRALYGAIKLSGL